MEKKKEVTRQHLPTNENDNDHRALHGNPRRQRHRHEGDTPMARVRTGMGRRWLPLSGETGRNHRERARGASRRCALQGQEQLFGGCLLRRWMHSRRTHCQGHTHARAEDGTAHTHQPTAAALPARHGTRTP